MKKKGRFGGWRAAGFVGIATVVAVTSTAYACTVMMGNVTGTGSLVATGSATTLGAGLGAPGGHSTCPLTTDRLSHGDLVAPDNTAGVKVVLEVTPSRYNYAVPACTVDTSPPGSLFTNRMPAGLHDVRYLNTDQFYHGFDPGNCCPDPPRPWELPASPANVEPCSSVQGKFLGKIHVDAQGFSLPTEFTIDNNGTLVAGGTTGFANALDRASAICIGTVNGGGNIIPIHIFNGPLSPSEASSAGGLLGFHGLSVI